MKVLKNSLVLAMMIVSGILFTGCSTHQVYTDYVKGTDFSGYKSYAWIPSPDTAKGSVYSNEIIQENLRNVVNKQMDMRNFQLDVKNPDLLLITHLSFEEKQEYVRTPIYQPFYYPGFVPPFWSPFYYNNFYGLDGVQGYDVQRRDYTQGTLIIDMIDKKQNKLVWRGWTKRRIDPNDYQRHFEEDVAAIFKKFPVSAPDSKEMAKAE